MSELSVKEWRRYSQDRLYVNDERTRSSVGYFDRKTGQVVVTDPARKPEVLAALRPFLYGSAPSVVQRNTPPVPAQGKDLADNKAGDAVSRRAAELAPRGIEGLLTRLFGIRTAATSWQVGAAGERIVGARLDRLKRDGWKVLQSVELGSRGDIDHLVIGRPGVFTINTKHHAKARIRIGHTVVWVNGFQQPYIQKSRNEAAGAARRLNSATGLPVRVTPVLAFVHAGEISFKDPAKDVLICRGERIDKTLRRLPGVLTNREQEVLYSIARHSQIWTA